MFNINIVVVFSITITVKCKFSFSFIEGYEVRVRLDCNNCGLPNHVTQ